MNTSRITNDNRQNDRRQNDRLDEPNSVFCPYIVIVERFRTNVSPEVNCDNVGNCATLILIYIT